MEHVYATHLYVIFGGTQCTMIYIEDLNISSNLCVCVCAGAISSNSEHTQATSLYLGPSGVRVLPLAAGSST